MLDTETEGGFAVAGKGFLGPEALRQAAAEEDCGVSLVVPLREPQGMSVGNCEDDRLPDLGSAPDLRPRWVRTST